MKALIISIVILFSCLSAFSFDKIELKSGKEIEGKIVYLSPTHLRYQTNYISDDAQGIIPLQEINKIIYQNGTVDEVHGRNVKSFGAGRPSYVETSQIETVFYGAYGAGKSYGFSGIKVQAMLPGKLKPSLHVGVGFYGDNKSDKYYLTAGLQIYLIGNFYVNAQYGTITEPILEYSSQSSSSSSTGPMDEYHGFAVMGGYDLFFTRQLGLNMGFGIEIFENNYSSGNIFPALDLGFIVRFN
jgi:hypothetical protein